MTWFQLELTAWAREWRTGTDRGEVIDLPRLDVVVKHEEEAKVLWADLACQADQAVAGGTNTKLGHIFRKLKEVQLGPILPHGSMRILS